MKKSAAAPRSLASGLLALALGSALAGAAHAVPDAPKNWEK